jgi:hypothetical protein
MKANFLCLTLVLGQFLAAGPLLAQDSYPLPPEKPSTWRIPGESSKLVVPERPRTGSEKGIATPPLPGNEASEGATGPSGETEEKYTGTRAGFGGIGGTGITSTGTEKSR